MKIPVHNKSAMPMYVHGVMIPAGETAHFDENDVPPEYRPVAEAAPATKAEAEARVDPVDELLKMGVKDVIAGFESLTDEELDRLEDMENDDPTPRKTLLHAITEEKLQRAAAAGEPENPDRDFGI